MSDDKGIEVVALDCKTYPATTLFPFLPPQYQKVAFRAEGVTFVVTPAASAGDVPRLPMSFHLPNPGDKGPLNGGVVAAAKLVRMFRRGVRLAIVAGKKRIEFAESRADEAMPDEFLAYAQAIENAATVMAAFGVASETVVDCGDLAEQAQTLQALAAIAKPRGEPISATVTFKATDSPPLGTETAAMVTAWWATFGDRALLVIPAIVSKPQWATDSDGIRRLIVSAQTAPVRLTRVLSVADAKKLKVRPLLDAVMQELVTEGIGFVVGPPRRPRG
jgi:hypothetical protein